jgi:hypothetical protein
MTAKGKTKQWKKVKELNTGMIKQTSIKETTDKQIYHNEIYSSNINSDM